MPKTFLTCLVLASLLLVLTEASKKGGKSRGGSWGNSGSNHKPKYPGDTGGGGYPSHGNTGGGGYPSHGNTGGGGYPSHGNTGGGWNPHNNPGSNWNPSHNNPGSNWNPNPGSSWNQGGGYNYNPGGSSYNKQFKPPKNKPNLKLAAGAAAAAGIGGFMLGNAFSNMRYHFDNDMENRYYNNYRNQMPSQVYRPMYHDNIQVTQDRFVTDCYNTTMTEYVIKPADGKNSSDVNDTEIKVKSTIIRQMCVSEYQRGPQYYGGSGLRLLISPMLILISLFVYFVVQ